MECSSRTTNMLTTESFPGNIKKNGVWRHTAAADDDDPDDYNDNGEWLTPRERLLARIPEELKVTREPPALLVAISERLYRERGERVKPMDPITVPDWEKIGAAAGLDEGERTVER